MEVIMEVVAVAGLPVLADGEVAAVVAAFPEVVHPEVGRAYWVKAFEKKLLWNHISSFSHHPFSRTAVPKNLPIKDWRGL